MMNTIAACTIVSKNYLPFARTLADSFMKHHKDASFFVLLADKIDGYFDPSKEKFQLIEVDELDNIRLKEQMFFKYNVMELSTAVKPFFLEYLFNHYPVEQLLYLDPDILIAKPLNEIQTLLDTYSIVVIPHITSPISINDKSLPNEMTFLQCGAYNLGFIGLSKTKETLHFIQWWKERLWHYCLSDVQMGLFVDQKWIDLVPSLFEKVHILKEPAYNVAYWNLQEKTFAAGNDKVIVNGTPLYFFHFSGLNVDRMESISKYQTRYTLSDFKELRSLFELYKELLIKNGYRLAKTWPYSYGVFDNGEKIEDLDRRIYWAIGERVEKYGNPFQTKHLRNFYAHLRQKDREWKIFKWVISSGMKHKEGIRKLPFIGRIAKAFYRNFLLLRYKDRTSYGHLGVEDHDSIYRIGRFGTSNVAKWDYGINLAGYLDTESGVGESARCLIKMMQSANIPFVLNNLEQPWLRRDDKSYKNLFTENNPFSINLLHVNADQTPKVARALGRSYFWPKYNIGYWYWETSKFPYEERKESFDYFDEIWVASNFCLETISAVSSVPVIKIPPAVKVNVNENYAKSFFGVKADSYAFVYIFDFFSFVERKNPFAVIEAFKLAYRNFDMQNAVLIIKCSNSDRRPKEYKQFLNSVKGLPVLIIDKYLPKDELHGLMNISDCYVSLHRAEGFGLPIAEAMYLGKPVIVTGYSGNMDFANNKNSFLVNYDLVEIKSDIGPYRKGCEWAEPDVTHAASLMFRAYKDQQESTKIGQEASLYIKKHYSPEALSIKLLDRLQFIHRQCARGS